MIQAIGRPARAEVARALRLSLYPAASAVDRRRHELGYLASLLADVPCQPGWTFARIMRKQYDLIRPPHEPSSARLVERYGSWSRVCHAAHGLQENGSWIGPGQPWPNPARGKPASPPYQLEEVVAALREAQVALQRRPSFNVYVPWRSETLRQARQSGSRKRLPSTKVIYRYFPREEGGWKAALREAGID
jgi:hypothetical protein